jgi:peptidoglycan/LPS O-acetylase OafA/YrhL
VIVLISIKGTSWSNANLLWTDLASAPAIGCLLAAIATSKPRIVVRFLNTRPLRSLGSFSYSLYLTHLPIVIAVAYGLVLPQVPSGTPTFFVLVAILVPTTVLFARLFAAVFELPFQRHRGWKTLLRAIAEGHNSSRRNGAKIGSSHPDGRPAGPA